jgi:TPR repeat protein
MPRHSGEAGETGTKRQRVVGGVILAAQMWGAVGAFAGPWEDGMAAYNRGDYVPAVQVFRAMAAQGNAEAQMFLGVMYRKGRGVTRSSQRAFVWFARAAARGNTQAKTELREVSQTMTPQELTRAKQMMEACEASDYRNCEY